MPGINNIIPVWRRDSLRDLKKGLTISAILAAMLFLQPLHAQFARKSFYKTEQQRRAHFALDDWISYTKARRFSNMSVGTHYLYIASRDGGILRYHLYENYWDYPFTTSNGLPSNDVREVIYDFQTSLLWASTAQGLAVFDPARNEWISRSETPHWNYETPTVRTGNANDRGVFFGKEALLSLPVFFANDGFTILNDWRLLDSNFEEFEVIGYLIDRFNRIWFLVDGFGLGKGDMNSQRVDFFGVGLPDIEPRALEYMGDDLWVGGVDRQRFDRPGIAEWPYNENSSGWNYYQARWVSHLPSDNVYSILAGEKHLWFGTEIGVSRYDVGQDEWKNFGVKDGLIHEEVNDLAIFKNYLYIATDYGISRLHIPTQKVERIRDARFLNLQFNQLVATDSVLWAGTYRGVFRLDDNNGAWQFFESKAAVSDFNVTALDVFDGEAWFAGGGGVYFLDLKTDKWESFSQLGFEIGPPYRDLMIGDQAVWIATTKGLLKYDRRRKHWRLFQERDGLLDDDCYRLLLDGDYIWIATRSGITQFFWNNPDRFD